MSRDEKQLQAKTINLTVNRQRLATKEQLLDALKTQPPQILDARSISEHCGETTTAKRNGAIPGAIHWEWTECLDPKTKHFKQPAELQQIIQERRIDLDKPAITYCQSGGRAAVLAFTLELMGGKQVQNYYRSWSEWGNADDTPIVKPKLKK